MQLSANIGSEEKYDECNVPEQDLQEDSRSRKLCMGMIIVCTVICVLASIIAVIYTIKLDHCHNNTISAVTSEDLSPHILSRREWLAQPPIHPLDCLQLPVPYVIILHTGTENCSTQMQCVFMTRQIQTHHMKGNGWWDIAYNFLVGGDGAVYEGRGWDRKGAFAHGYNNISIGITFIGTFQDQLPPPAQIVAAKKLIEEGVVLGTVAPDYKLLAHRQVSGTKSPGDILYEDLQTWPHWAETP